MRQTDVLLNVTNFDGTTLVNSDWQELTNGGTYTEQYRWLEAPSWARSAQFYAAFTGTGVAPFLDFELSAHVSPVTWGTGNAVDAWNTASANSVVPLDLDLALLSPQTLTAKVGPGVTGIADDNTQAAGGGGVYSKNLIVPGKYVVYLIFAIGDETYTGKVSVVWSSQSMRP